jgi:hypothetical protein
MSENQRLLANEANAERSNRIFGYPLMFIPVCAPPDDTRNIFGTPETLTDGRSQDGTEQRAYT